jgi:hypothetical protein
MVPASVFAYLLSATKTTYDVVITFGFINSIS